MKAVVFHEYGGPDVLNLEEVEKPEPGDNEILVRIKATSVNYGDLVARNFGNLTSREFNMPYLFWLPAKLMFGAKKPKKKIPGSEFSGIVEKTGNGVTKFKKGDEVFGYTGQNMGAYAEYICVKETSPVALKPKNMSHAEAASIPYGSLFALSHLEKVKIEKGDNVLVNGASGGIGSAAVQILANVYGAVVTGVCGTKRVKYVKSLGAQEVIDYTNQDFTDSDTKWKIVYDILGRSKFSRVKNVLTDRGIYLLASFKSGKILQMLRTALFGRKKVKCVIGVESQAGMNRVRELAEAGKIKAIVDKKFPAAKAADAHRYVEEGNKKGNIVITMD